MPLSLNTTGKSRFSSWAATGEFTVTWRGKFTGTSNQAIVGQDASSANYIYLINTGSRLRIVINSNVTATLDLDPAVQAGDIVEVIASRDANDDVLLSITIDGETQSITNNRSDTFTLDNHGDRNGSLRFSGETHYLSLIDGSDDREYTFAAASGTTTISNDASGALPATDATISGDAAFTGIENPLYHTLRSTRDTIALDGLVISTRADVDNASTIYFTHRSRLVAAIRDYDASGNIDQLDRAIAYANNFLNLRDDIYADNGGTVFTGTQTGYRSAPPGIIATSTPVAAWSYDYTDTAANGNPEAEGRRLEVLTTARLVSALAEIVNAYYNRLPAGNYTAPAGAESGILSGSYASIVSRLMQEINATARVFDGLWQSDYTGRIGPSGAGTAWVVDGSYFYPTRQNLSVSGLDADNVLPWNHSSGMLYARLVISRFGGYDSDALDHFKRWFAFYESIFKSDDVGVANPGLADIGGDIFGLQADGTYSWNYVAHEAFPEDIDHVIITLEVIMLGFRLGLLTRSQVDVLYGAVESVYHADSSAIYDRIHDTSNGNYTAFPGLAGTAAWLSTNSDLITEHTDLTNVTQATGQLHIREEEGMISYHVTEQLGTFPFVDVVYDGSNSSNSFVDFIFEQHAVTLANGDTIHYSVSDDFSIATSGQVSYTQTPQYGWYGWTTGGTRSDNYSFSTLSFDTTISTDVVRNLIQEVSNNLVKDLNN